MKQKLKKIALKKRAISKLGRLGGSNNVLAKTSGQPTCAISTPIALCFAIQNAPVN